MFPIRRCHPDRWTRTPLGGGCSCCARRQTCSTPSGWRAARELLSPRVSAAAAAGAAAAGAADVAAAAATASAAAATADAAAVPRAAPPPPAGAPTAPSAAVACDPRLSTTAKWRRRLR